MATHDAKKQNFSREKIRNSDSFIYDYALSFFGVYFKSNVLYWLLYAYYWVMLVPTSIVFSSNVVWYLIQRRLGRILLCSNVVGYLIYRRLGSIVF